MDMCIHREDLLGEAVVELLLPMEQGGQWVSIPVTTPGTTSNTSGGSQTSSGSSSSNKSGGGGSETVRVLIRGSKEGNRTLFQKISLSINDLPTVGDRSNTSE